MGQFGELGFDISEDKDNFGKYMPGCLLIFGSTCLFQRPHFFHGVNLQVVLVLRWSRAGSQKQGPLLGRDSAREQWPLMTNSEKCRRPHQ